MWYNEPSGPGRFIIHNVTVDIILIIVITNTHATSSSRIILSAQCPNRFDSQPFNVYLPRRIAGGTLGQWSLNFLEKELNLQNH